MPVSKSRKEPAASRRLGRPKSFNGPRSAPVVQALDRGLDVLDALASSGGMTLTRLAEDLGQSVATVHRILFTLEQRRFVEIGIEGQTWHVGPEAYRLGSAFLRRTNVVERSRPMMRKLMLDTGETSNLAIRREGHVLFLSQVETHESIRAFFPPGTLSPLHASGIGKVLLANHDQSQLLELLGSDVLQGYTSKTITTLADLRRDLELTRQRGFAFDDEERTPGMRCVAAPLVDMHGEAIAGISVSGPTPRMSDQRIPELGELVARAAAEISRQLGAS